MKEDLNMLSVEKLGILFPIKISEYCPDWKTLFASEKEVIQGAIGIRNMLRIEHIGSTAVPGLSAKPTIDILLEIKKHINNDLIINKLISINYSYIPKPENPPPHMMFAKGYSNKGYISQTYHIHVRYKGDWDEVIFRDYLIQNPKVAQEYAELKFKLASDFLNDREKYTNSKTEFITRVTSNARNKKKKQFRKS